MVLKILRYGENEQLWLEKIQINLVHAAFFVYLDYFYSCFVISCSTLHLVKNIKMRRQTPSVKLVLVYIYTSGGGLAHEGYYR